MATKKLTHGIDSPRSATAAAVRVKQLPRLKPLGGECPFGTSERPVLVFEATRSELIASGLIEACDLPDVNGLQPRSIERNSGNDFQMASFRAGGRVRLYLSAHLVRQRDAGFVNFLARTVGIAIVNMVANP